MKYGIAHECRGRIRIRIDQKHMSLAQADLLEAALRIYQGRALYEGGLSEAELKPLGGKYGVIYYESK